VRKQEERAKVHVQSMERRLEKALSRVEDKVEELRSEFEEPIFKENVQRKFHYVFGDHIGDSADVVSRSELKIVADVACNTRRQPRGAEGCSGERHRGNRRLL
jgi:BMFP domain-containing protein YqiC